MKGGPLLKCGYRLCAAHIRCNSVPEFHSLRAGRFQSVVLALVPRAPIQNNCNSFAHSGRRIFVKQLQELHR
eukprot:4337493-Pyramimonas_sp.AAC.1